MKKVFIHFLRMPILCGFQGRLRRKKNTLPTQAERVLSCFIHKKLLHLFLYSDALIPVTLLNARQKELEE